MLSGAGGEAATRHSCAIRQVFLECSHRVSFPFPSWSGPFPLEPELHWPGSVVLYWGGGCRGGGEPERLEGERLRPCSAALSRTSCRDGEELSERWREEEELRGRGGGLRSNPPRSCISCVRLARKSASLVLLARTRNRRRLESRAEEGNLNRTAEVLRFAHVSMCSKQTVCRNMSVVSKYWKCIIQVFLPAVGIQFN